MKNGEKSMLVLGIVTAFIVTALFLAGLARAGDLEPSAAPGPTMKTLDQIPPTWSQKLDASERFELVLDDEAVLDKETGLTWARNANLDGTKSWQDAINYCANLTISDRKGWRLPTREELASLLDISQTIPALPIGYDIFSNVQSNYYYWSSTEYEGDSSKAWYVYMGLGHVRNDSKNLAGTYVWPVRGGN